MPYSGLPNRSTDLSKVRQWMFDDQFLWTDLWQRLQWIPSFHLKRWPFLYYYIHIIYNRVSYHQAAISSMIWITQLDKYAEVL